MIDKASGLDQDEVILDLEDSVAPAHKQQARINVVDALRDLDWGTKVRGVRINDVSTPWALRDLVTVMEGAGAYVDSLLVPKVQDASQVAFVDHALSQLEAELGLDVGRVGLELQVEDAQGLVNADEILATSQRTEAFVFGPGDMAAALGMPSLTVGADQPDYPGDHWHHVLMSLVVHARARGVQPIDGPYARIRDVEGLREASVRSRVLGFDGKWVLHPDQIAVANDVFGVDQQDFERACDILDAYEHAAVTEGRGAATFGDEMIDEATRKMAEVTRARGAAQGLEPRKAPDEVAFDQRARWRSEQS